MKRPAFQVTIVPRGTCSRRVNGCGVVPYSTGEGAALKGVFLVRSGIVGGPANVVEEEKATPGMRAKARQQGGVAFLVHLSFVVTQLTAINMPGNDWPALLVSNCRLAGRRL